MPRESQLEEHSQCCRKRWKLPEVCLESVHIFFLWSRCYEPPMNTKYLPGIFEVPLCYLWPWACFSCAHFFRAAEEGEKWSFKPHKQVLHLEMLKWLFQFNLLQVKMNQNMIMKFCFVFFSSRITSFMGQNKKWCILVPVIAELELSPACARFLFLPLP